MPTTTKRELLLMICEHPGADPGASSQTHEWADELVAEGWIEEAMGGFTPSAKALDEHPHFVSQPDIADPSAIVVQEDIPTEVKMAVTDNVRDRVAMLYIVLMTNHVNLGELYRATGLAGSLEIADDAGETKVARDLADRLLQGLIDESPEPT